MQKNYFVLKLIPSRPDFSQTMTDEERETMQAHVAYLQAMMKEGKVLVYGPVLDPLGVYGIAIASVEREEEVQELIQNDPAGKINRYEYCRMLAVVPE